MPWLVSRPFVAAVNGCFVLQLIHLNPLLNPLPSLSSLAPPARCAAFTCGENGQSGLDHLVNGISLVIGAQNGARFMRMAPDMGGPGVEAFEMISES